MHRFLRFILGMKVYMFRTVPLSIIRSFSLYTQQWYMSCKSADSKPVWHIPLLWVQWKTPEDGQRNCPKHVEFHSKNKFEKSMYLVGFIIRNWTRCAVTRTSNSYGMLGSVVESDWNKVKYHKLSGWSHCGMIFEARTSRVRNRSLIQSPMALACFLL